MHVLCQVAMIIECCTAKTSPHCSIQLSIVCMHMCVPNVFLVHQYHNPYKTHACKCMLVCVCMNMANVCLVTNGALHPCHAHMHSSLWLQSFYVLYVGLLCIVYKGPHHVTCEDCLYVSHMNALSISLVKAPFLSHMKAVSVLHMQATLVLQLG